MHHLLSSAVKDHAKSLFTPAPVLFAITTEKVPGPTEAARHSDEPPCDVTCTWVGMIRLSKFTV
jgi:hypothetical protein